MTDAEAQKINQDINIHISDYRRRSNLEKFVAGMRELAKQTGMNHIEYGGFKAAPIVATLLFDNGESIGINRLFWEVGFSKPKEIGINTKK